MLHCLDIPCALMAHSRFSSSTSPQLRGIQKATGAGPICPIPKFTGVGAAENR